MKLCNKKLLSIGILVLCVACFGFVGAVSAEGLTVTADKASINTGDTVTFTINPYYTTNYTYVATAKHGEEDFSLKNQNPGSERFEETFTEPGNYKISVTATNTTNSISYSDEAEIVVNDLSEISSVSVTLAAPEKGVSTPTSLNPSGDGVKGTATVAWYPAPPSNIFEANKNYSATITLSADTSHKFTDKTEVTVNGAEPTSKRITSADGATLEVTQSFPATSADETPVTPSGNEITSINITIDEPETGKTPANSLKTVDNTVTCKGVQWSTSNSFDGTEHTFVADTKYYARITLQNESGYVFGSTNPTIKVNGDPLNAAQVTKEGNNKLIVIVDTFDTTSASTISSVSVKITAPATGNLPATNGTTEATTYEISDITWYKNGTTTALNTSKDKFEQSAVYKVEVTLKPASSKYSLSGVNSSNAKINGNAVSEVVHNSDKTITISHTFPATDKLVGPGITFSIEPSAPTIPSNEDSVVVTYKYSITGNPLNSTLYFGDGSYENLGSKVSGSVTHVLRAGSYLATLQSSNENADSEKQITFTVSRVQLLAKISASPSSGAAPLSVTLSDASSGAVTSRSWDFGDGSPGSTEKSVSHSYQKPGTYTVKLTVSDGKETSSTIQSITVTEAKKETTATEKEPKEPVDYEPLLTIGDVDVPSPVDLIAEFVRMFQSLLDFDNYIIFSNETTEDE